MARVPSIYTKLSPKKRDVVGFWQLWLASDHILVVRSSRFQEEYKRFLLRDIQAVVVTELPHRTAMQVALYLVAFLMFFFAFESLGAGRIFFIIVGAIIAGVAVYDFVRGPRCVCLLLTEVSSERLHPISRMSIARRFLQTIQPAVEAVQGSLAAAPSMAETQVAPEPAFVTPPLPVPLPTNRLPRVLYSLLLVDAAIFALGMILNRPEVLGYLFTAVMGELLLGALILRRRPANDLRWLLYSVTTLTVVAAALNMVAEIGYFGYWVSQLAEMGRTSRAIPPMKTWPWMQIATTVSIGWRVLAGVAGWLSTLQSAGPEMGEAPSRP